MYEDDEEFYSWTPQAMDECDEWYAQDDYERRLGNRCPDFSW